MKHIKQFEKVDWDEYNAKHYHRGIFYPGGIDGPLIGDWVVINNDGNLRIGKVDTVDENAPFNLFKVLLILNPNTEEQRKFWFEPADILFYSKVREDCIMYLQTKKYNL